MLSRLGRTLRKRNPVYETLDATCTELRVYVGHERGACVHVCVCVCVCVSNGMNVHLLFCRYGTNGQETAHFEYFWNWIKTILDRGQHSGPVVSSW